MTRPPPAIRDRQPASATIVRPDGRNASQLRPLKIERGVMRHAEGSALVSMGNTRVICTASIEDRVPPWLRGQAKGWVTAEYGMLPRSTGERTARSNTGGRVQEIQRLIGRSLRTITDLKAFGERMILIDCDVIEADGGTRTAAINGALVALHDAFVVLSNRGHLLGPPLKEAVAAVSVGLVDGSPRLDLAYAEDAAAQVDMNVVMTGSGHYVEVQGTGESVAFSEAELKALLKLARSGIKRILAHQRRLLGDSGLLPAPRA
jgi:ribonuclease PH